jgi:hypothetical protein
MWPGQRGAAEILYECSKSSTAPLAWLQGLLEESAYFATKALSFGSVAQVHSM